MKCRNLKELVDKQADDWRLWGPGKTCGEDAQKALRRLHALIEDETWAQQFYSNDDEGQPEAKEYLKGKIRSLVEDHLVLVEGGQKLKKELEDLKEKLKKAEEIHKAREQQEEPKPKE